VRPILLRCRHSSPTRPRPDFPPPFGLAPPLPLFPNTDEAARRWAERSSGAAQPWKRRRRAAAGGKRRGTVLQMGKLGLHVWITEKAQSKMGETFGASVEDVFRMNNGLRPSEQVQNGENLF
jgi:hypothetical protein